jgi:hypothetical protein
VSKYHELGEGTILGERMKLRIKIALVVAIAAVLAAVGAGWKWMIQPGKAGNANAPYKVADGEIYGLDGWSWGDG